MTVDQVVSPVLDLPATHPSPDLAHRAIHALEIARSAPGTDRIIVEERAVYRPESWLIQRSWEVLAEAGEAQPALEVARLAGSRQPAAVIQCLYRLSRKIDQHWGLGAVVARELAGMQAALLRGTFSQESSRHVEQLLFAAATAANLDERSQAFIFLERLDQLPQPWDRIMVQPDQRSMLANTVLRIGPHPLTVALMTHALRRFGDAGAHFVLDVTTGASERLRRGQPSAKMTRFMNLGVSVFRNASLTSLHSRRLTATVLGQAGLVDEVLEQLTTIANVQAARRESGLALRAGDKDLLRQVKRPSANADIDFQVYTLREAIRGMAPRQLTREQRIQLADQLALLGSQSDGWTAAGAATTLVELGAVKYAQDVIGKIPAGDPTRSEGIISLVRALLVAGEPTLATEYVQKGLIWAHSYPGRNPERALVWGLAEVYLERNQPEEALALLDQRQAPAGFLHRVRGAFNRKMTDDELRDEGLRLQARLLEDRTPSSDIQRMVKQLQTWAPRLLDGEARVNFLVDDMLRPLLASGRTRLGLSMLPSLLTALATGSGEKHAMRVATIANVILYELAPVAPERLDPSTNGGAARPLLEPETRQALEDFIEGVWRQDAARGVWQTVHGVEGSLRLLLALDGPEAVISIARAMASVPVDESV